MAQSEPTKQKGADGTGLVSGLLERRATPPKPAAAPADEPQDDAEGQGRGRRRTRSASRSASKKTKPRTIHLSDDVYERVVVQALRRGMRTSEYIESVLSRQVPDHRVIRVADTPDAQAG